ncbi:hypothetical protein IWQ60_001925 [Tieghemiomyces parasiticus]|uniref:DH domain-containing protein n=1 Tax=Tieghemiomyces parasiticus TaxID=78921 RepID=A0A9W8E1F5_9FUNG|nr:hypothetical protein IWQ60_001925 [Tieghemiomyces parasiticus]
MAPRVNHYPSVPSPVAPIGILCSQESPYRTDDDRATLYYDCPANPDDAHSISSDDHYHDARPDALTSSPSSPPPHPAVAINLTTLPLVDLGSASLLPTPEAEPLVVVPFQSPLDTPDIRDPHLGPGSLDDLIAFNLQTPLLTPVPSSQSSIHTTDESDSRIFTPSLGLAHRKVAGVLRELWQTEQSYLAAIEAFVNGYLRTIKHSKLFASCGLLQHLIRHLIPLVYFQKQFCRNMGDILEDLEATHKRGGIVSDDDVAPLADLFIAKKSELEIYLPYCSMAGDFASDIKVLERSPEWLHFARHDQLGGLTRPSRLGMQDFLMKPVQRLCLYPLLLREVVKCLTHASPAAERFALALDVIRDLTARINDTKRVHEMHHQTEQFYRRYDNHLRLPLSFIMTLGDIVFAGALEVTAYDPSPPRVKYYGCILFPRFLVVVKTRSSTAYEPKYWFPLAAVTILEWPSDLLARASPSLEAEPPLHPLAWRLVHEGTGRYLDFTAACPEEKAVWLAHLSHGTLSAPVEDAAAYPCSFRPVTAARRANQRRPSAAGAPVRTLKTLRRLSSGSPLSPALTSPYATAGDITTDPPVASPRARPSRPLSLVTDLSTLAGSSPSTVGLYHPGSSRKSLVDTRFSDIFTHDCLRSRARALATVGAGPSVSIHTIPRSLPLTPVSPVDPIAWSAGEPSTTSASGSRASSSSSLLWSPLNTSHRSSRESSQSEQTRGRRAASDCTTHHRRKSGIKALAVGGAVRSRSWLVSPTSAWQPSVRRSNTDRASPTSSPLDNGRKAFTPTHTSACHPCSTLGVGSHSVPGSPAARSNRLLHLFGRLSLGRPGAASPSASSDLPILHMPPPEPKLPSGVRDDSTVGLRRRGAMTRALVRCQSMESLLDDKAKARPLSSFAQTKDTEADTNVTITTAVDAGSLPKTAERMDHGGLAVGHSGATPRVISLSTAANVSSRKASRLSLRPSGLSAHRPQPIERATTGGHPYPMGGVHTEAAQNRVSLMRKINSWKSFFVSDSSVSYPPSPVPAVRVIPALDLTEKDMGPRFEVDTVIPGTPEDERSHA